MIERWVSAYGFPRYAVSQLGNVYDHHRDTLVSATPDRNGYLRVKLHAPNGVRYTYSLHRLVASSFYDIDPETFLDSEVNHIDGDKSNCAVWNLEFSDRSRNMIHAFENGLAKPMFPVVAVRCIETGMIFNSTGEADRFLGVSSGSVSKTIRGLQPTCKGFTFERLS